MVEIGLWDANGGYVGTADVDGDPPRDGVIEHGSTTYVWNQRNGQWRQASGVVKLKGADVESVAPATPAKAPEKS